MDHQAAFASLADHLQTLLRSGEVFLAQFEGEESDFIRLNHARVRQAGSLSKHSIYIELIDGERHAGALFTLSGDAAEDRRLAEIELIRLRETLPHLPTDPHLFYATDVQSTERIERRTLPTGDEVLGLILDVAGEHDLVGIYAAGAVHRGFANSLGQRNWFSNDTFNFEWTFYHHADKAIKDTYAGFVWDDADLRRELEWSATRLDLLGRPPHELSPGAYRAFLEPAAIAELLQLARWGGFGLEAVETKTSPLLHFWQGETPLSPRINLAEKTAGGTAPEFDERGFIRPPEVLMIRQGQPGDPLVSPRSAHEYGRPTNGANNGEWPESMELAGGRRSSKELMKEIDHGLYLQRLWYLNWSDRAAARITGMTRFACFWVEQGELIAPLPAMRFDETLFHILGDKLLGLSKERERIFDPETYDGRTTQSCLLPGALIDDLHLTL